jgi:hypothetical protein
MRMPIGDALVAVVSDGAGSVAQSARGAAIVTSDMQRCAREFLRKGGELVRITEELVADWLDSIRERIVTAAAARGLRPREFAATLVALLVCPNHAVIIHVGDGAAVVRECRTGQWIVPSWPYHGEFASTTCFVTDDPQANFVVTHIDAQIDRFAIFTDGLEYLFLDFRAKSAPAPFFEKLLEPLSTAIEIGRSRRLSRHLRNYLASEMVCNETDDDKTLLLGTRT